MEWLYQTDNLDGQKLRSMYADSVEKLVAERRKQADEKRKEYRFCQAVPYALQSKALKRLLFCRYKSYFSLLNRHLFPVHALEVH